MHVVPSSHRKVIAEPRSSTSSLAVSGPYTTTTYKISPDPPNRGSSVRESSRSRRSTVDNSSRPVVPTIVTATPRHRPVVHGEAPRPASPLKNPYRSSEEEYYAIPGTSKHAHHRHHKHYSATMDNADMNRLARERESSRLRVEGRREVAYTGRRNRDPYSVVPHRHADTVADDYGDNGYGYTNPRDLVQYDLDNNTPPRHHPRRDSFEGGRARPSSITSYNDVIPRPYDTRERGPPPSTRGFDKVYRQAPSGWEQSTARIPVAPMDPVQRPARVEPPFDLLKAEPQRRRSLSRRPVSLYHDRDKRQPQREEYYEVRDDEPRHRERSHRHERYDDDAEKRGFSVRPERVERSDRAERSDRPDKKDQEDDKHDHKGRDALTTGLSLAGAALGVKAFKDAGDDDRDGREEPRRRRDREHERDFDRDYDDESRRRRDPRERDSGDLSGQDTRERRRSRDGNLKTRGPSDDSVDISGRDPRERYDERDGDTARPRPHRSDLAVAIDGTAVDSRESSASDEATPRSRRPRRESGPTAAFDPKNTMDLKALKEALNSQTPTTPKDPISASARTPTRTPRESISKDAREVAEIRSSINQDPRAPRIVTPPPMTNTASVPVKGILRQPREKFPEDPAPIREGVAPLKDAKKDGVPPDARWTKISRKLVNPEALEAGKERYEAREDFVIVLRVLSRDEVQQYAEITEKIRGERALTGLIL